MTDSIRRQITAIRTKGDKFRHEIFTKKQRVANHLEARLDAEVELTKTSRAIREQVRKVCEELDKLDSNVHIYVRTSPA